MTTSPRTGFLEVAGAHLEFARESGLRAGPTLLLLHEGLGCVALWRDFPARLAAATGLPVFTYSRAGYGGSSPIELPRPLDFHTREAVDVLPALLDAAALDEVVLVGHSDGASIALVHAGACADPRVRALALLAPHVFTEDKCLLAIGEARLAYLAGGLRERLARRHGDNVDNAFWGWCDTWLDPGFRAWSIERWLAGIRVPVLTVRGDSDPYNTPAHVERIVGGVAGPARRVDLADCGHAPHSDQPDAVLAALADFLTPFATRPERA